MRRIPRWQLCCFLAGALLVATAHRAPAPIQEIQESPTPVPTPKAEPAHTSTATPTPRRKSTKDESGNGEQKRTRLAPASATVPPTPAQRQTKRFAGRWTGTMRQEDGKTYPVTVVVDPTETRVTANGPVFADEPGRPQISGDTLSWSWMLDTWSMTLNSEKTAQLVKRYFGSTHTGTVQRVK